MGRISGARNKDHGDTKDALVRSVMATVLGAGGNKLSMREIAKSVGADPTTLRHYFHDRRGLILAVFDAMEPIARARRESALAYLAQPAASAFIAVLKQIAIGWPLLLGNLHALGFAEGFSDSELGQRYVATVLEPLLVIFEEMLAHYTGKAELDVADARVGAIALVSPVVIGLMHQHQLSGNKCRPLDVNVFIEQHVAAFLRGYAKRST